MIYPDDPQTRKAYDYSIGLVARLRDAQSDDEIVAICQETEKAVMRLREIGHPGFHHVVNFVQLRRRDFAREKEQAKEKENKQQMDLWR